MSGGIRFSQTASPRMLPARMPMMGYMVEERAKTATRSMASRKGRVRTRGSRSNILRQGVPPLTTPRLKIEELVRLLNL